MVKNNIGNDFKKDIQICIYKIGQLYLLIPIIIIFHIASCKEKKTKCSKISLVYETFRDSLITKNKISAPDSINFFDDNISFIPQQDSINNFLLHIDTMFHQQAFFMEQMDSLFRCLKFDRCSSPEEKETLKENIQMLDSFLAAGNSKTKSLCREKECYLYVEVIKSKQMLYLYIGGQLKDSFLVSTGVDKYTTPDLNVRPSGPIFTKYTSKKFPGGNYKGLGNMPYSVFVKGGYAIHGTTLKNIPFLGRKASHGCIRLHPDNAKVLYELVKLIGFSDVWVNVRDFP